MKKSEFASHIASRTSLTRAGAEAAVNAVLTTVTDTLAKGDTVTIAGFGTFSTRTRPARRGRNPRTGEVSNPRTGEVSNPRTGERIAIRASTAPSFKAGKTLRDAVG